MVQLSKETVGNIEKTIDEACKDQRNGVPGVSIVVVDRDGKELVAHASGHRGSESSEPMTLENVYWIASCTKMIVGIACMQLVEKKVLSLDDADQVEKLCPELKNIKVLADNGKLVEKKKHITLRMLLSHTAGFGYTFFNEKLRDHSFPLGMDEFSGANADVMDAPLVNQPGDRFEYGTNIDWAGILLERATKSSLNDYLHAKVFGPLGLKNISMHPTSQMVSRLVYMNQRNSDGKLFHRDHLLRRPLIRGMESKDFFHSGGAGCFAQPQDYAQILATLLNDGVSPRTSERILQQSTVTEMFRNQISEFPNYSRQAIPASKPELTNPISELYPVEGNPPQGWGLTFMLSNGGVTGRSTSTGHWAGLPNCWWWCDREKEIAGIVCCQILPFVDAKVLGLWFDVEGQVYAGLKASGSQSLPLR